MGIWDTPVQEAEVVSNNAEPVVDAVKAEIEFDASKEKPEFKGLPVRGNGDRIYLLKGGKKHWVRNAEIYSKLGFKFGDEKELDFETLQLIPEGEPISE